MKYAFIERHRERFALSGLCRALKVSRSGFYAWRRRAPSGRAHADARLLVHIRAMHAEHRQAYGAVKTWHALKSRGIACGKHRVARLRREAGIRALRMRRFPRSAGYAERRASVAPDLIRRRFVVAAPNRIWLGDTTCVRTGVGWLHLAIVLDLFARRIVGWAMGPSADVVLALRALDMAIAARKPLAGLIHHTDQGAYYTSRSYRSRLELHGFLASNSSAGACYDNAPAESFFSTLKNELTHHRKFVTPDEARAAIFEYVECFYNRKRLHQSLSYRSPEAAERDAVSPCPQKAG